MDIASQLCAGIGLSASAGVRAYVPLLVIALTARYTDLLVLTNRQNFLKEDWVLIVLIVFAVIETLADKIPGLDHINDAIHIPIRIGAGALSTYAVAGNIDPVAAVILGGVVSGGSTAVKVKTRAAVSATTVGHGNFFSSIIDDFFVWIESLLAVSAPYLAIVVVFIFAYFIYRVSKWKKRRKRKKLEVPAYEETF